MDLNSLTGERADLADVLTTHRDLFLIPYSDLTDDQARSRPTVSELSLGGLVKHVTAVEAGWQRFIRNGPQAEEQVDWENVDWSNPPAAVLERQAEFTMLEDETLAGLLADYRAGVDTTVAMIAEVDLDSAWELPPAPWFTPGATWSARRVFTHILAETAQHAGHADFLREAIDGHKSMG